MATSITQAKPLLTAAELELFDQSRAEPIKAFNTKQIEGKEKRARTLRDKYRDLYQRQTVAQRGKAKAGAKSGGRAAAGPDVMGEANARTQRKAEILQEVLERFEARGVWLQTRAERASEAPAKGKPAGKTSARKTADVPVAKRAPAAGVVPAQSTGKDAAAGLKTAPVKTAKTAGPTRSGAAPTTRARAKSAISGAAAQSSPRASKQAPGKTANGVAHGVEKAVDATPKIEYLKGKNPERLSDKAPSKKAPTQGGKAEAPEVHAPLDMVASAERKNPVRSAPRNVAIQGHAGSAVRRAQGKKDSR